MTGVAGNVTPIRSGGQIAYRLGGAQDLDNEQVAYRLGQQNDARQVFWIGDGATAEAVGVTPGAAVTASDVERVQVLMEGVNPVTGEVLVAPKVAVAESAKLAAVPAYDAIVMRAAERGLDASELFYGARDRSEWASFSRMVQAKGDVYRVPVERLEALGAAARVDVSKAYRARDWAAAVGSKGQRESVGIKGYDVGLTLTKGASLALVMADPDRREQLAAIARKCAQETYRELGERIAYGAKGHHGGGQSAQRIAGTGFAGTATMEVTSRAGDPHVHFHAMIANLTICEDGKARTIGSGGKDVLAHGAWASERFRMKYREETAYQGLAEWGWNEKTSEYDELSISADAVALASKRHNAIATEKEIFGPDAGKAIDAMAERITRDAKPEATETMSEVAARFAAELAEENLELRGPNALRVSDVASWTLEDWAAHLDARLTEHNAVFTRVKAEQEIARTIAPIHGSAENVTLVADAYLAGKDVIGAEPTQLSNRLTDGQRYTTQAMLDGEKTVYETTANGLGRGHHAISLDHAEMALAAYEAAEGFTFNDGQRAMFVRWTAAGNQVDLIIGAAGTGKTAAADAARFAWEAQGLRVLGISTSGLAAQNLGAAAGVEVSTAYGLAAAITAGKAPAVDVLIWDEMGMASTREQAVILPWAAANGVDVRGMGDPKQLDSVGTGSTFGKQCEQIGAVELTEIMRQRNAHEREAVTQLRLGDATTAFAMYAQAGQIEVDKTPEDRIGRMAAAWAADAAQASSPHERLSTAVMLSQTNATVEQLHDAARAEARARGWITGPDVDYRGPNGTRAWAVGDAMLIRKTIYSSRNDPQPEIFNGQRAIVTGIDPVSREMGIEWIDAGGQIRSRTLEAGYVAASTAPGLALTNHGAQGQTIRHVHADPAGADRNTAYVQLTRDTHRVTLYTDLNTLGISGTERVTVLRMDDGQRAAWAARQLGHQVDDHGWQQGETAHDATTTPIPMPEPEQTPPAARTEPEPDTRPEWLRQAFPDPSAPISREKADTLLAQRAAQRAEARKAQAQDEERTARIELATTPKKQRPYWLLSGKDLEKKADQLRETASEPQQAPQLQAALDTKSSEAAQLRATADSYASHGQQWDNAAEQLEDLRQQHRQAAIATVRADVAALKEADDDRRQAGRFTAKKTQRHYDDVREWLGQTYPAAGVPQNLHDAQKGQWAQRAVQSVERGNWGDLIERNQDRLAEKHQAAREQLDAARDQARDLSHTVDGKSEVWQRTIRDAAENQPIEKATKTGLWESGDPKTLVADTQAAAAEIKARQHALSTRLDRIDGDITKLQHHIDKSPQRAEKAARTLTAIEHEQSIRQAQPPSYQRTERESARNERQRQAEKERSQQAEHTRRTHEHEQHHNRGPSQSGPSLGL